MKLLYLILFLIHWCLITCAQQHLDEDNNPSSRIPAGYRAYQKLSDDLNHDGVKDSVLVIKATDSAYIVKNRFDTLVNRNRRGLLIFLNENDQWKLVMENLNCFTSENEDGGVYYPPQMNIQLLSNQLKINYEHGRYGYWEYSFEFNDDDFDLIYYEYHASTSAVAYETSITILDFKAKEKTHKELDWEHTDEGANDPKYLEKVEQLKEADYIKLSEITDFETLKL